MVSRRGLLAVAHIVRRLVGAFVGSLLVARTLVRDSLTDLRGVSCSRLLS